MNGSVTKVCKCTNIKSKELLVQGFLLQVLVESHHGPSYPHCRLTSCYHLLFVAASCILVYHNRTGKSERWVSQMLLSECGGPRLGSPNSKSLPVSLKWDSNHNKLQKVFTMFFLDAVKAMTKLKKVQYTMPKNIVWQLCYLHNRDSPGYCMFT